MKITNIYVRNDCLVFCDDGGGKSIYHLSNIVVDTGLSIDSLDANKFPETRIEEIIKAEGEQIAAVEIKGVISKLENADNCLDISYNETLNSCVYYFSGQVDQMLNQLFS